VSAYLFTLTYPNSASLSPVVNGKFGVTDNTDMAYLYIGSINNQSATTVINWQQYQPPGSGGANPKPKGAMLGTQVSLIVTALSLATTILILY
jgi:hypothetical protein